MSMNTKISRRSILSAAPVMLPALAIPAFAAEAEPDPVIAMAENCRAAYERIGQTCEREPTELNGLSRRESPIYIEWKQQQEAAHVEYRDLESEMFATGPRTKAGAAALIRYHLDVHSDFLGEEEEPLLASLLSYLDAVQS